MLSFLLFLLINSTVIKALPQLYRTNEICDQNNGRRHYLELGDHGELRATNITVSNQAFYGGSADGLQFQCSIEFVTCASCVVKIEIRSLFLISTKSGTNLSESCASKNKEDCNCDFLWLSEPPYDKNLYSTKICGQETEYRSKTRSLSIKFMYKNNHTNAFYIKYISEKNQDSITEYPGRLRNTTGSHNRFISSSFFPSLYPRDYGVEHILTCSIENCRIQLVFLDFKLSYSSTMEIYDYDGERMHVYSGIIFRPPILISNGPSLMIRFYANGGTGPGYKAKVTFLFKDEIKDLTIPVTDCGGVVETLGGAITMMKMLNNEIETKLYDCIWLIKPPNSFHHLKSHVSLRIEKFEKMSGQSELIIRQGLTSDSMELEILKLTAQNNTVIVPKTYVVPLKAGFYVSLKGAFNQKSYLAIVYTAFSYMDCFIGSEFLCQNHRCIPVQLHCDGFDHCGDGSDEPISCELEWEREPFDRRWYSHTPNYYFPKMDEYPDLRTATAVFIISSLGLILLIGGLIILLYRMGSRARNHRDLQGHIQTISDMLDNNSHEDIFIPDEPPTYEAPPDYSEVIKVGIDSHMSSKRRRRKRSDSRRRSSENTQPINFSNTILEVSLPEENTVNSNFLTTSGLLETTATNPTTNQEQKNAVPQSPPPTYFESNAAHQLIDISDDENVEESGPIFNISSMTSYFNTARRFWDEQSWQEYPSSATNYSGPYVIPVENLYVPYSHEVPTTSSFSSQNYIYQQILSPQKYKICKNCSSFIFQTNCKCFENGDVGKLFGSIKKKSNHSTPTFGSLVKSSSFEFYDFRNYDLDSRPIYRSKSDVFNGIIAEDIRMGYLSQAHIE